MLPLDAHAHIEPDLPPSELAMLRACVLAVTRSLDEYDRVAHRDDACVAWGVGCHPGLARAVRGFDRHAFLSALESSAIVGEVGLDGRSRVPMEDQRNVLEQIFEALDATPRLVSVHSYRATKPVLDVLDEYRPKGVILHWWLGTTEETTRAIELDAHFSVNAAQAVSWPGIRVIPSERLLVETDHPFGDRRELSPQHPGRVDHAESRLGQILDKQPEEVRRLAWQNLRRMASELNMHGLFPHQIQVQLLAS